MLRYSLMLEVEAQAIESAVSQAIHAGQTTGDLGGKLDTHQATQAVIQHLI
jgi:isocitrate/isopropylmalate dehydrogenase